MAGGLGLLQHGQIVGVEKVTYSGSYIDVPIYRKIVLNNNIPGLNLETFINLLFQLV